MPTVGLGDIKIYHRQLLPEKLMRLLPILHYHCIVSQVSLYTCLSLKFPIIIIPLSYLSVLLVLSCCGNMAVLLSTKDI